MILRKKLMNKKTIKNQLNNYDKFIDYLRLLNFKKILKSHRGFRIEFKFAIQLKRAQIKNVTGRKL